VLDFIASLLLSISVTADDLDFMFAQEAFVHAACREQGRTACPKASAPDFGELSRAASVRRLIDQTGDPSFRVREAASWRLRRESASSVMSGLFRDDLEIRLRCNTVLRRKFVCGPCRGSGRCIFEGDGNPGFLEHCIHCKRFQGEHDADWIFCAACGGRGSRWRRSIFGLR